MKKVVVAYIFVVLVLFGCGGSGDSVVTGVNPTITTTLVDLSAMLNELVMIRDMVALPDGSILATGFYQNSINEEIGTVFKLRPDATLDANFGDEGKKSFQVESMTTPMNLAVASDGSIFVSGTTVPGSSPQKAFIVKLTATGQIDTTFGAGGSTSHQFSGYDTLGFAMGMLSNGKIIVGCRLRNPGSYDPTRYGLVSFNSDGSLDTTFGVSSEYISEAFDWFNPYHNIIIQDDDAIVAGIYAEDFGSSLFISKLEGYNEDGTVNTSFGNNGYVDISDKQTFLEILQKQNGNIITVGWNAGYTVSTDPELTVLAYDSSGNSLSSFGTLGQSYINVDDNIEIVEPFDIAESANGTFFVALYSEEVPDPSGFLFPQGGLQLAQFDSDGLINASFGNSGVWVYDGPGYFSPSTMAVLPDNTVYIGGTRGDVHVYEETFLLKVTVN